MSAATIDAAQGVVQAAGSVITQYPESLPTTPPAPASQALRQIASKDLRQIIPTTTDKWMLGVISRGEATFSLDTNRHVMNQRRRLPITNSLPVTENWTRVAQMAHFVANRCHTPRK